MHRTLRPLGASTLTLTLLLLVLQVFRLFRMLTLAKSTQSPTPRQFLYRTDSKQITWEKNTIGRFPLTELVKSLAFRGFLPGFLLGISRSVSIVSGLLDLWYLVGETRELMDVTDLKMAISKTRISSSRAIVVAIGNTMVVANPPNWNSPTILQQHWFSMVFGCSFLNLNHLAKNRVSRRRSRHCQMELTTWHCISFDLANIQTRRT